MTCGVYLITNKLNGKQYVGSSLICEARVEKGHLMGNTKTKGMKHSAEVVENIRKGQLGHPVPQSTRDAVAKANRERKKQKESK